MSGSPFPTELTKSCSFWAKLSCQEGKMIQQVELCQTSGTAETDHLSLVRAQSFSKWTTSLLSEHRGQLSLGARFDVQRQCHFPQSEQTVNTSLSDYSAPLAAAQTLILPPWERSPCKRTEPSTEHQTIYDGLHGTPVGEKRNTHARPWRHILAPELLVQKCRERLDLFTRTKCSILRLKRPLRAVTHATVTRFYRDHCLRWSSRFTLTNILLNKWKKRKLLITTCELCAGLSSRQHALQPDRIRFSTEKASSHTLSSLNIYLNKPCGLFYDYSF